MKPAFPAHAQLRCFDRQGGFSPPPYDSLNVGLATGDQASTVWRNRAAVQAALGPPTVPLVFARQVHGTQGVVLDPARLPAPTQPPEADILLTRSPALTLALYTADCTPILLAHPRGVAAAHGGWRGAREGIAAIAARALAALVAAPISELSAHLGPSIGPCCYLVRDDVARPLRERLGPAAAVHLRQATAEHTRVALHGLHRMALCAAGLPPAHVHVAPACTACTASYFSHRRDGPASGRQASTIRLRPAGS